MAGCPTCDDSFDTERGVKIHHTQVHGVSLNEFHKDQEWVRNDLLEIPVEETDIDRIVKHLEHTLTLNQEKYNLEAGPS